MMPIKIYSDILATDKKKKRKCSTKKKKPFRQHVSDGGLFNFNSRVKR